MKTSISKAEAKSKTVNSRAVATTTNKVATAMKTPKPPALKFIERAKPESYSVTVALRVKPSEKAVLRDYAEKNGVTLDTVLRSALVAAGVLAA